MVEKESVWSCQVLGYFGKKDREGQRGWVEERSESFFPNRGYLLESQE